MAMVSPSTIPQLQFHSKPPSLKAKTTATCMGSKEQAGEWGPQWLSLSHLSVVVWQWLLQGMTVCLLSKVHSRLVSDSEAKKNEIGGHGDGYALSAPPTSSIFTRNCLILLHSNNLKYSMVRRENPYVRGAKVAFGLRYVVCCVAFGATFPLFQLFLTNSSFPPLLDPVFEEEPDLLR